jgi:hypothetical protein
MIQYDYNHQAWVIDGKYQPLSTSSVPPAPIACLESPQSSWRR